MRAGLRASFLAAMIGDAMLAAGPIAVSHEPEEPTIRTRHKRSGSQPVPGGGARERARHLARMEKKRGQD